MAKFKIHDIDSAPEASKPLLEASKKGAGFVPNLHGVMAESPQHLEGYKTLHALFEKSSLSVEERNVVWLAINVRHACHYCVPAHTMIAQMQGVSEDIITTLREDRPLENPKLEALRVFTLAVVDKRGVVSEAEFDAFFKAGFAQRQALDVVLGVAQKVMSNYVNHFAQTPVDEVFKSKAWEPRAAAE